MWPAETLKDQHGGTTTVSGRQMYSTTTKRFQWITKLVMAFNEGKLPMINTEDHAFLERMMTISHRSRFQDVVTPEDPPHTFQSDPQIKSMFPMWKPYFLKWMLTGLRRYHIEGFRNLPDSCLQFKRELVASKDVVGDFLEDAVEEGGPDDFVVVKELFHEYDMSNPALQKDKKTRKDSKAFARALSRCLGVEKFKAQHLHYVNGKRVKASSVYIGLKRKL